MFGLIPTDHVASSLSVLGDEDLMLGRSGVRSLSKTDQFYQYQSNYWRGAVWINVNFLVLRGLNKFYIGEGVTGAEEIYKKIRQRLIDSVYKNWRLNHVFWEQYNDQTQLG